MPPGYRSGYGPRTEDGAGAVRLIRSPWARVVPVRALSSYFFFGSDEVT